LSRYRRAILIGSPILAVAIAGAAITWLGREAVGARPPGLRALIACDARPTPQQGRGTWWRTHPRLDATGTLTGWRVEVGPAIGDAAEVSAPAETAVSGPVGGVVVVAVDDGSRSRVDLVSAGAACTWTAYRSDAVVRRAIPDPTGSRLVVHLVDRATRADLGVRAVDRRGGDAALLPPIDPAALAAARIDRVWSTDLRFSADGARLAVQSCGESSCVTRVATIGAGGTTSAVVLVDDAEQGGLVGFAGDQLVTWASCRGLPCDLLAIPIHGGPGRVLVAGSVGAAMTADGRLVATTAEGSSERDVLVDVGSGRRAPLPGADAGRRPLSGGPGATAGLEVAPDEIAVAAGDARPLPLAVPQELRP
jgi:hypothetical protein